MASWEVWLDDTLGNRIQLLDGLIEARATKVANARGVLTLLLPAKYDNLLHQDSIIEVWRQPTNGELKLFNAYFLRRPEYIDDNTADVTRITGVDANYLLEGRIINYAAGSTDASASNEAADDLVKRLVRFNLGASATGSRSFTSLGVTVANDVTLGPGITLAFSRKKLYDTCKEIAERSRNSGYPLYYEFVPVERTGKRLGFDFRTYINQPGNDLTGVNQVVFGKEFGNLRGGRISEDHIDEFTVVVAGGQGLQAAREVETVTDATRSTLSPWAYREAFYNVASQASSSAEYYAAGAARLEALRGKTRIEGEIVDTDQARFGVDWNWGDRVMINHRGQQYSAIITALTISMSQKKEMIEATFEAQA